jgi:hypothetical protein
MRALLAIVEMDGAVLQIVDAAEAIAAADRPVHRHRVNAEHALDFVEQVKRIAAGQIQLVDEGQHRQPAQLADFEQLARLRLDALRRVDHHHDAVDGEQRAVGVLAEVLVARRVEQRQVVRAEIELHRGGGDRNAALALDVHPVGDDMAIRLPAAHGARQLDGARVQQQFLGQGCLACVWVGNDRERATTLDFRLERRMTDCGVWQMNRFVEASLQTRLLNLLQEFYQFSTPDGWK